MQLLLTLGIVLAIVWSCVIAWEGVVYREGALKQASQFSLSMHNATLAGLTGMMVTGTMSQRDVFLDQIKQLGSIQDVRILAGPAVAKMFGEQALSKNGALDQYESEVMRTGQEVIRVERTPQGEFLRTIRPVLAKTNSLGKNCIACHQVPENTVLGVVGMKMSLASVNEELAQQRLKSIFAAIATSIPVLLLIYPFILKVVTRPLAEGIDVAGRIASGDLTKELHVSSSNEMGELQLSLRSMSRSLMGIVGQTRSGINTIFHVSGEIAQGNAALATRTGLQAQSLGRTASAIGLLTAAVGENAAHAQRANDLSLSASDIAVKGGDMVAQVVETMDAIHASSKKVEDITSVIDAIAFQTNILALNAAVEAARAGEQGKGFAVVAAEVRNLAKRSATAAKEIQGLIHESVTQVQAGSTLVHQTGRTMKEIVESVRHVTEIMRDISQASTAQTEGIAQVNHAVAEMNQVTNENTAMVKDAALAAQALLDQATHLEQVVSVFKLKEVELATS